MLMGRAKPGLRFSRSNRCSRSSTSGGMTMIGVALSTRLTAVSPTASIAALLLLPRLSAGPSALPASSSPRGWRSGKTSMPAAISPPRIRPTLTMPAETTAAKGTRRPSTIFRPGLTPRPAFFPSTTSATRRRATARPRPTATPQLADTASTKLVPSCATDSGDDLFAFAELMHTLSVWFAICHATTPRVVRPGCSMPVVTRRLVKMKALMRNGRNTGAPVSGCSVASQIFFARHSGAVIAGGWPCLYVESSACAAASRAEDVNSVLQPPPVRQSRARGRAGARGSYRGSQRSALCLTRPQYVLRSWRETGRSRGPGIEEDIVACGCRCVGLVLVFWRYIKSVRRCCKGPNMYQA